jgi:hypothetical protein
MIRVVDTFAAIWKDDDAEDEAGGSSSNAIMNVAELALYDAVRQVLGNAMRILGLVPLEV